MNVYKYLAIFDCILTHMHKGIHRYTYKYILVCLSSNFSEYQPHLVHFNTSNTNKKPTNTQTHFSMIFDMVGYSNTDKSYWVIISNDFLLWTPNTWTLSFLCFPLPRQIYFSKLYFPVPHCVCSFSSNATLILITLFENTCHFHFPYWSSLSGMSLHLHLQKSGSFKWLLYTQIVILHKLSHYLYGLGKSHQIRHL